MKFFLDNNLPPAFALGLEGFSQGGGLSKGVVIHLRDRFPANTPDLEWIQTLTKEGGWVIISQDGFRKNDLERAAIRRSGLFIVVLSKQWTDHKYWDKAQNLVKWWPSLLAYIEKTQGAGAVRIPWRHNGKFEQVII